MFNAYCTYGLRFRAPNPKPLHPTPEKPHQSRGETGAGDREAHIDSSQTTAAAAPATRVMMARARATGAAETRAIVPDECVGIGVSPALFIAKVFAVGGERTVPVHINAFLKIIHSA